MSHIMFVFLSFLLCGAAVAYELQVMTYNIRCDCDTGVHAWDNRKANLVSLMLRHSPDIMGVQEAEPWQRQYIDSTLTGYKSWGRGRNADGSGEGSQVYYKTSRWELDTSNSGTFQLSDTPDIPGSNTWGLQYLRICTYGRLVDRNTGQGVWIFNTHFPLADYGQRKAAVLIASRIASRNSQGAQEPVFLTGDFNAGEDSSATNYFKGYLPIDGKITPVPLEDSFRVLYPNATDVGTFGGWGRPSGKKIDYVYALRSFSSPITVTAAQIDRSTIDGLYPSDHACVTGSFQIGSTPPPSPSPPTPPASTPHTSLQVVKAEFVLAAPNATDNNNNNNSSSSSSSSSSNSTAAVCKAELTFFPSGLKMSEVSEVQYYLGLKGQVPPYIGTVRPSDPSATSVSFQIPFGLGSGQEYAFYSLYTYGGVQFNTRSVDTPAAVTCS